LRSLHFAKTTLHFPKLQGETGSQQTASSATQSVSVVEFRLVGKGGVLSFGRAIVDTVLDHSTQSSSNAPD